MNPNEELKMSQTGPKERTFGRLVVHVLWFLVCLATFGFPAKYRERLRLFEGLHDLKDAPWSTPATHSDRGHKDDSRQSMRQKQQEEWDRLNIAVSVITATSAAALAIQATSNNVQIYWLVTAFYSIAFGLSLEGLIIITYMTISAGGSSDEAIARLAQGKLLQVPTTYQTVKPVAFMMALPAILATYSSMSLLLGLVAMVVAGPGEGVNTQGTEYILVTIIPVGVGFLFLCTVIIFCEIGNWIEIWGRRKQRGTERYTNSTFGEPASPKNSDEFNEPKPHCSKCCPIYPNTPKGPQDNSTALNAARRIPPLSHSRTMSGSTLGASA